MSGGQEKIFSILGPKLSESNAHQYYWDKTIQIRVEQIDYNVAPSNIAQSDELSTTSSQLDSLLILPWPMKAQVNWCRPMRDLQLPLRDLDPNLPIWTEKSWIGEIYLRLICWARVGVWHSLATWTTALATAHTRRERNTQEAGAARGGMAWYQMGHLALQLLTQTRSRGGKNSQLSSVSVCASNDFRKCDLLAARQGCEEIHGSDFILPPWNGLKF